MAQTPSVATAGTAPASAAQQSNYTFPLVALTTLFFMWGFITCLNDILIPHLKNVFSLNYAQAMMIQFCFFFAYFVCSVPAGALVKRVGYKSGIVLGLVVAGIGCCLFYPAAGLAYYPLFLGALFVLASGITLLQVSANPYVAILGKPETASSRLNLTQAFNSLGTTVAPFFGAFLILGVAAGAVEPQGGADAAAVAAQQATAVQKPYLLLAGTLFVMAAVFFALRLPAIEAPEDASQAGQGADGLSAWSYRHLVLGAGAIFLYVGAEVAIGSFLVNYLAESNIAGLEEAEAAHYVAYYWGGAMVGRFIGSAVLQRIPAGKVLAFNAVVVMLLLATTISTSGAVAMWSILAIGLFNSIMFPTIFTLGIAQLGRHTSQGSGALCLAIVGGAIVPPLQGLLADSIGIQMAFVLPIVCYAYIAYYGLVGSRPVQPAGRA